VNSRLLGFAPGCLRDRSHVAALVETRCGHTAPVAGLKVNDVEPLRGRRILVAEDEAAASLMIEDTLREAGYIVVGPVATVYDALALVESEAIDCAILDIELADGKVGPVAEALVKRGVRFVVATGHDPGMIERPYASVPMLGKAFDLGQLLDAVADIIDRQP
jgi:CheY-like chemotaxis protein